MTAQDDLTWLVEQRSKIQKLLLDLHAFGKNQGDGLLGHPVAYSAFQLLVGAAFSLWRAAFLTEPETTPEDTLKHLRQFLETLVRDNMIGYQQDKATQAWTAGYYLNNAYCRLNEAIATLGADPKPAEFSIFCEQNRLTIVSTDRRRAWEIAYAAATAGLAIVQRLVQLGRHGARGSS